MDPETLPPKTQAVASPSPIPPGGGQLAEFDRSARVLLILTVIALAGITLLMMALMVPKFSRIFNDMLGPGTPLPFLPQILISHAAAIIGAVATLAAGATAVMARTPRRTTLVATSLIAIIPLVGLIIIIPFALMRPLNQIIHEVQK